jgi:hypothetical protein
MAFMASALEAQMVSLQSGGCAILVGQRRRTRPAPDEQPMSSG